MHELHELIDEMYREAFERLLVEIRTAGVFSIFVDETRDASGHEQLCFSIRWVADNLSAKEEFVGIHECLIIDAETISISSIAGPRLFPYVWVLRIALQLNLENKTRTSVDA